MDRIAFILYLLALIIAPLLFAAVHTYAYTLVFLLVFTTTLLVVMNGIRRDLNTGRLEFVMLRSEMAPLFILMAGWLVFQMVPLPEAFVKWISPEAWVAAEKSLPASVAIGDAKVEKLITLAPYTYPVRQSLIRWAAYSMLFFGLSATLNSTRRMTTLVYCLLTVGCFEVVYGLIQTFSGNEKIWWFTKTSYRNDLTGTYINRNHFAGLMEMLIPVAIGFAAGFAKVKKHAHAFKSSSLRVRLAAFLSLEQRFSKRVAIISAGILMGIGTIFSASRGGMLAVSTALVVIGLLMAFRRGTRKLGLIALLLFVFSLGYAIYIGVERPMKRFDSFESSYEERQRIAKHTILMMEDYPVSGVGLGNFINAYPKYQSPEDKNVLYRYAHNDWIQLLGEAGLAGFFLFLVGSCWFLGVYVRKWQKRRDRFAVGVGAGTLAALSAIALHSYSDFNLHMPANTLVLAAVLALGSSAVALRRRHGRETLPDRYRARPLVGTGGLCLVGIIALLVWCMGVTGRHFLAESRCNTVKNSTLNREQEPPIEAIDVAIAWDDINAMYWFTRGMRLKKERRAAYNEMTPIERDNAQRAVIKAFEAAIKRNPFNVRFYIQCGNAYAAMQAAEDYRQTWLPAADLAMERAAWASGPDRPDRLRVIANYWVFRSKTFSPVNPQWFETWSRAVWLYQEALSLETGMQKKRMKAKIRKTVWKYYPDEAFVAEAMGEGG